MNEQELLDQKIKSAVDAVKNGVANSEVGVHSVDFPELSVGELSVVLAELKNDGYNALCVNTQITCNKN